MPMPPSAVDDASEVVADERLQRRQRRSYSAEFKRRILEQASACQSHGEVAALLRKHGLYSSHLSQWRAQFAEGGRAALATKVAGRKPRLDAKDRRIAELERENAKLAARLELSEKVVAFQKKAQELLAALSERKT